MRNLLLLNLAVFVSGIASLQAAEPREIVEKAIRAAGGPERVAKLKVQHTRAKGLVNIGAEVPFTWNVKWQWPNQFKIEVQLEVAGKSVGVAQTFDGVRAWGAANGAVAAVEGAKLEDLKAQVHLRRVLTLAPLLTDKAYQLDSLEAVTANDRPAAGIKITSPGERDIKLYFDQETGLLSRIDRFVFDDGKKQVVAQEDFLTNYQDVDGVKTAMKEVWMRGGIKVAELEYTEVNYPETIAAREFARPAGGVADELKEIRTTDVIYGRKLGMAMTMDVFKPKAGANGAAIILVISGGWVSDNAALNNTLISSFVAEPIKRGYTVFAVFHGSQPKFTIPEAVSDLNRAVRYIRYHARDYQIDPDRIGITGGSAGGHLSLMQGTAGDLGNDKSDDMVDRESSRVQAVACLFPPTDFLNYGGEGKYAFGSGGILTAFRAAVDVREFDPKTFQLERPADEQKRLDLAKQISPITHVSSDDPPTLIVHGDADGLVPIQQAELLVAKLKAAGVPAELVRRAGRGHDFAGVDKDIAAMTDWFDEHLKKK